MNTLVVFAAIIAAAVAGPINADLVAVHQDTLGNYKYSIEGIHGLSRVEQHNIPVAVSGYSFIEQPILRKVPVAEYQVAASIPVTVEASPQVAIAKTESLPVLRRVELVQSPLIKELEIPQVSLVKSPLVETVPVHASLLRVAAVPESPEILDLESKQFAAHVALQNSHKFI